MAIEYFILPLSIAITILLMYSDETSGKWDFSDFLGVGALVALCVGAIVLAIGGLGGIIYCSETNGIMVSEETIEVMSWERIEQEGCSTKVKYLYLDDLGYQTAEVYESHVFYNQKMDENSSDFIIKRSYDFKSNVANFFFWNAYDDIYSLYTIKEKVIYSK